METREWRWLDKSAWGSGEWTSEPDKKQWADAATGLPCLIVRGPFGALCGYVGVPQDHPAFGLHYDGVTKEDVDARSKAFREDTRKWADAGNPPLQEWLEKRDPLPVAKVVAGIGDSIANIEVHGGLTFAGKGASLSKEDWLSVKALLPKRQAEAARYPIGDAARWLREWAVALDDYSAWREQMTARTICHAPSEGDTEIWWFGFDCSHAGDVAPGIDSDLKSLGMPTGWGDVNRYRNFAYVEREVVSLANQLSAIKA